MTSASTPAALSAKPASSTAPPTPPRPSTPRYRHPRAYASISRNNDSPSGEWIYGVLALGEALIVLKRY